MFAVLHEFGVFFADGFEFIGYSLTDNGLEVAVAFACKFGFDFGHRFSCNSGINGHQVADTGLVLTEADHRFAVGDGALELLEDDIFLVENGNRGFGIGVGLAHLAGGVLQAHNACPGFGEVTFRQLEDFAVVVVEAGRDVTRELQMLGLVSTYGHIVGLIEQDVPGHQSRIGEKTGVDVFGMFAGFILELGHAAKLAKLGAAAHKPAHFRMAPDMALDEDQTFFRVNAAGEQQGECLQGLLFALGRINMNGQGVQVSDEVIAVVLLLHLLPVLHSSEVVAQREDAGGLNARENDFFLVVVVFHDISSFFALSGTKKSLTEIVSVRDENFAVPPCFMAVPCP